MRIWTKAVCAMAGSACLVGGLSAPTVQAAPASTSAVNSTASAEGNSVVVRGSGPSGVSAAEEQDLANNPDLSEGQKTALRYQGSFNEMVEQISELTPTTYVTAEIGLTGDVDASIAFTEKPSASTLEKIGTVGVDTLVEWGYPANEEELEEAADAGSAAAAESVGPDGQVYAEISDDARSIDIQYSLGEGESFSISESTEMVAAVEESIADTDVEVVIEQKRDLNLATEAETYAGGRLNLTSGAAHCTAAFNGVRGGDRGLITARHCDDALRFNSNVGWIAFDGVANRTANGNAIDMQFHRAINGTATPAKMFTGGNFRTVVKVADPVKGSTVCKYGRTSGYACGTVYKTQGVCYKPEGLNYCGLVAMTRHITQGGDSGGPWFYGNTAMGVHSGRSPQGRSLFTKISMAGKYMSTSVRRG